jgi:hypothetical protein
MASVDVLRSQLCIYQKRPITYQKRPITCQYLGFGGNSQKSALESLDVGMIIGQKGAFFCQKSPTTSREGALLSKEPCNIRDPALVLYLSQ